MLEASGDPSWITRVETGEVELRSGNISLPAIDTYYNCRLFRLPNFSKKHHLISVSRTVLYKCERHFNKVRIKVTGFLQCTPYTRYMHMLTRRLCLIESTYKQPSDISYSLATICSETSSLAKTLSRRPFANYSSFKLQHFFQIEPLIQNGNEANVHHILLYQCVYTEPQVRVRGKKREGI